MDLNWSVSQKRDLTATLNVINFFGPPKGGHSDLT
jgi:hypothetical protein